MPPSTIDSSSIVSSEMDEPKCLTSSASKMTYNLPEILRTRLTIGVLGLEAL
jgi:hypothetical protein